MAKLIATGLTLAILGLSGPAFAQKASCEEVCNKRCSIAGGGAGAKNWCMGRCVPSCNMNRSSSGKK